MNSTPRCKNFKTRLIPNIRIWATSNSYGSFCISVWKLHPQSRLYRISQPLNIHFASQPTSKPTFCKSTHPKPAFLNALASLKSIIATDRQTKQFQTIKMTAESIRDFVNIIVKMLNSHSNLVISQKILWYLKLCCILITMCGLG